MTNVLILSAGCGAVLLAAVLLVVMMKRARPAGPVAVVPPPHVDIAPEIQMARPTRTARGSVGFPSSEPRTKRPTGIRPSHAGRVARSA